MVAKPNNIRKILLVVCAVILVCSFIVFALEKIHIINLYSKPEEKAATTKYTNTVDYSPPKPHDNDTVNQAKQDGTILKEPSTKPISVTLTRAYQDQSTKTLVIRTLVEGQPSGTCRLELIQNNVSSYSKGVSIFQQNNIFTCGGFDILKSELPGIGEWTIKVTAEGGGTSNSAQQNVLLEK